MALEVLGCASNAAGLVSLGLTVCHGLLQYYDSWKTAESDMRKMYDSLESLAKTFTALNCTLNKPFINLDLVRRVQEAVAMCENGIGCLHKKLQKINTATPDNPVGWDARFRSKLQRALYPFKESTLAKLKEVCDGLLHNLQLALGILHLDTSTMSLETLLNQNEGIRDISIKMLTLQTEGHKTSTGVAELVAKQQDLHMTTSFEWLSPLFDDFTNKQQETFNIVARQDMRGNRLIHSMEYKQWTEGSGQLLWCLGSRGVGKTVLASFIIDHLQKTKSKGSAVAFIYGNYNDSRKQTVYNLIGLLLQQLATQDDFCMEAVRDCYDNHQKAKTRPSLTEYCKLLQSLGGYFSKVYVVIDALDEYDEDTRETILEKLGTLRPDFSLLVTSRHGTGSLPWLAMENRLHISADEDDIKGYLEERLSQCRALKSAMAKDGGLRNQIVSSIAQKAKGMFLLARLQLESLMAKPTLRKIKVALNALPEELETMYDQALERVRAQDSEYAAMGMKIICWVHRAARPLSLQEVRHALAVELDDTRFDEDGLPDEGLLESVCAGLVSVQEHRTLGLVHYTTQEYLSRRSMDLFPDSDIKIAEICLTYMLFEDFSNGPCKSDSELQARLETYPLIKYASQYWAFHLKHVASLEDKVFQFLAQTPNVESSNQVMLATQSRIANWSQEYTRGLEGLCLSSMHGLQPICKKLLDQGADVNKADACGHTPLHYAAIYAFDDMLQLLLDRNANLELKTTYHGRTALQWAAWHGHSLAVKQLLGRGANASARDQRGWTALHLAASGGYQEIVRILLDSSDNVNVVDGYGATALYRAAEGGHEQATQILLEHSAELELCNDYQQTALHRAADLGHLAVARLLLERGANYKGKDYYGWTPLYRAADHGHDDVAALLADFAEGKTTQCSTRSPLG